MKKILAAIACCLLLIVALGIKRFNEDFVDNYDIDKGIESISPDKRNIATEYTISGGGAAGYVLTRIQIRPAKQKFNATKESDDFVFEIRHGLIREVVWKNNKQLVITYEKSGDVYRTSPTQGDIRIFSRANP